MRRAVNYAIDRQALATADLTPAEPEEHYLPPAMPGHSRGQIYPIAPDAATARRLAAGRGGDAVFYTCNLAPCLQLAQIVKHNLAAIGIDVAVTAFPVATYLKKLASPDAPFDIAFFGHNAESFDPAGYLQALPLLLPDHNPAARIRTAAQLSGARRYPALATLEIQLARDSAPLAVFAAPVSQDFFSARMGCQIYNPLYGIDLAALCIRR